MILKKFSLTKFLMMALLVGLSYSFVQASSENTSKDKAPTIGIDLGTTYSCVGVVKNGNVEIIANDQGNRITPSYVAFVEGGGRLVGDGAKNQASINPENTIFDVKRLIGRDYSDASVQSDKRLVPYDIVSNGNNKPVVQVTVDGKEVTFAPEELSAMVLQKMKQTAESYTGQNITDAVVTVPAYFNDQQRKATKDAGTIAGLDVKRIINEPTAAAVAYGMDKSGEESNILVYDLGGGTFDVTVLTIDNGVFEVLSTNGDTHLGGEDFDQRIMQYFIKSMQKKSGINIKGNNRALQKLRKEVERVKRTLSSQQQARLEIEDLVEGHDFTETLTRARFEELNNDLFRKTLKPVEIALKDANLEKSEIDEVVLVGGSTRIPKVQSMISEYFDGKDPSTGLNPDEAVAHGAAVLGGVIDGVKVGDSDESPLVIDVVSLSKGIETVGGVFTKLINRGTTVPTQKSQVFSTNQDNQPAVVISVFEGERSMVADNFHLGKFELTGIPPAPRGVPQIEVQFQVDANGILEVTAKDKGSGKSEKITITANNRDLTEDDIERMIEEAERYAKEDKEVRERVDARNGLESYLYNIRNQLDEENFSSQISPLDKKDMEDLVNDSLDWMEDNRDGDKDDYLEKQKEVENVINPMIRKMYSGGNGGSYEEDFDFGDDEL